MGNSTKDKITIHIVNSVKGGCGKTAFSLFKAMELAKKDRIDYFNAVTREDRDEINHLERRKNAPVIWMDADFKGTATKVLFYGENEQAFKLINQMTIDKLEKEAPDIFDAPFLGMQDKLCFKEKYVRYTLNDYLQEKIREYEKMIVNGYAYFRSEGDSDQEGNEAIRRIDGVIDFIFSSPNIDDKKAFNHGEHTPSIEIGRFTSLMEVLITELVEIGRTDTKAVGESDKKYHYKHIVIDMPPGDDAYSNALLHMLRQLAKRRKDEIEIALYTLTTSDRGHIYAMKECLKDTLQKVKNCEHKETVYAVLGEIRENEFDNLENCIKEIDEIDNEKDIHTILCTYQQEYYENCRNVGLMMQDFGYRLEEVK
ncbi:MAG: hypothetical protein HFH75_09555 [Lachnospiraceae bacterium]|jgi:hypothetical protein|nr:hypothetical protein [Lachnospiraceae bacterium]